jgi:hypothetical protein
MVLMFPFAQMIPKLKNLALVKLTRIFLLPVLAYRWCWCFLSLAGNAEAEEPERAGDPLQDHQQRHDQRL